MKNDLVDTADGLADDAKFSEDLDNHYVIKQKLFDFNVKFRPQVLAALADNKYSTTMMLLSSWRIWTIIMRSRRSYWLRSSWMRTSSAARMNSQHLQTQEMLNDDDALELSKKTLPGAVSSQAHALACALHGKKIGFVCDQAEVAR